MKNFDNRMWQRIQCCWIATLILLMPNPPSALAGVASGKPQPFPYFYSAFLRADHDPVAPGDTVTYYVDYSTRAFFAGTRTIRLQPSAMVDFVGISDGGAVVDGGAEWYFEGINNHEVGRLSVTIQIPRESLAGSSISMVVQFPDDPSPGPMHYQKQVTTHIQAPHPLQVTLQGIDKLDLWEDFEQKAGWSITIRNASTETVEDVAVLSHLQTASWDDRVSLASDKGVVAMVYGGEQAGLNTMWRIGPLAADESRTLTVVTQWNWPEVRAPDFQQFFLNQVSVTSAGNKLPAKATAILDVHNHPAQGPPRLRLDRVELAPDPADPSQSIVLLQGLNFPEQLRVVFRSGRTRLEVPDSSIEYISANQIRMPVSLPSDHTAWVAHIVSNDEASHRSFIAGTLLRLSSPSLSNPAGPCTFLLVGGLGRPVSIQFSADLTLWRDLTNLVPTLDSLRITDSDARREGTRFYRALIRD